MNIEDLGNYFIKDGELYHCISYIDKPCMTLKNIRTGQKEVVVLGTIYSTEFKKLCTTNDNGDVIPVNDIYFNVNKNERRR